MNTLVGTGKLARLILRRDRFVLPMWTVLLGCLPVFYTSAIDGLYPTEPQLRAFYDSIGANPSLVTLQGPAFGPSLGALSAWRAGILMIFVGLASLLTVIRHTRADEDAGRRELLGATVVGRHAPLAAALAVTATAGLVLGAIMATTMMAYGLPVVGSLAMGLAYAFGAWLFAAVGAFAAQLTEGAGAARGIALGILGVAFLLRAAGDSAGTGSSLSFLSWLSPIGWVHRVRPYAGEQWAVLALLVAATVGFAWAAAALLARRDVGAGVLPARLGPADAAPALRSPLALAWRLHRGLLLSWTIGFAALGLVVGGASKSIDRLVEDSPQLVTMLKRLGGTAGLQETYLSVTAGMLALAAGAYAVQATMRMRTEEAELRAESVLATAVSRVAWLASHVVFALLGPAVVLIVYGLAAGVSSRTGDVALGGHVWRVLESALVQLPAVWVLVGVAVAMFGLLPRVAAAVAWGAVAVCVLVTFVGPLLQVDQRVLDVSPYTHIPRIPVQDFVVTPVVVLVVLAAALTVAGAGGFRRRDLVSA
jgi:ABC-2 type transport system permease protein